MVLSPDVIQVIDKYYWRLINEIPVMNLIDELADRDVLTDDEVSSFSLNLPPVAKNFQLIAILRDKEDGDFYQFCQVLQGYNQDTIQQLGQTLQQESHVTGSMSQEKYTRKVETNDQQLAAEFLGLPKHQDSEPIKINRRPMDLTCRNIATTQLPKWKVTAFLGDPVAHQSNLFVRSAGLKGVGPTTVGQTADDVNPKLCCPPNGKLQIISTRHCSTKKCQLIVSEYQSGIITFKLELPEVFVNQVLISPDGKFIAYSVECHNQQDDAPTRSQKITAKYDLDKDLDEIYNIEMKIQEWKIYQTQTSQQFQFVAQSGIATCSLRCRMLAFCPVLTTHQVLISISLDQQYIHIWKIHENNIKQTDQNIKADPYKIAGCQFIPNSQDIIAWWLLPSPTDAASLDQDPLTIDRCQIEIWKLQNWHSHRSFQVPAIVDYVYMTEQFTVGLTLEDGFRIVHVQAIYQNNAIIIILKYHSFVGYLMVQADQDTLIDLTPTFADSFQLLHKRNNALIENIIVSDDHRFIALSTNHAIRAFEMVDGQIKAHTLIVCVEFIQQLTFVPSSHHVLAYCDTKHQLLPYPLAYYDLKGKEHVWRDGPSQYSGDLIDDTVDSSFTFIDDIPVIALLMVNTIHFSYKISVYHGEMLQLASTLSFDDEIFHGCFMYENCQFIILYNAQRYEDDAYEEGSQNTTNYWHITATQFVGLPDDLKYHQQFQWTIKTDAEYLDIEKSYFRKCDDTLLFLLTVSHEEDYSDRILVLKANLGDNETAFYLENRYPIHRDTMVIYSDQNNFVIVQRINDDNYDVQMDDEIYDRHLKWFKFGEKTTEVQLVQTHNYHSLYEGIACRIVIPVDDTKDDMSLKLSHLRVDDKDQLIQEWGERDANLFINQLNNSTPGEILQLVKGNDFVLLGFRRDFATKGNQEKLIDRFFWHECERVENVFPNKYFMVINICSEIDIYDAKNLDLIQTIEVPAIKPAMIRSNQQQTTVICKMSTPDLLTVPFCIIRAIPSCSN